MILITGKLRAAAASTAIAISMLSGATALGQSAGCALLKVEGADRHVLRCAKGITIQIERGTGYTLMDRDKNGNADAIGVTRKAVLIDFPEGQDESGFRVITPQAIAAVRGTMWAVDVEGKKTSVFVVRGRVAVARNKGGGTVHLGPGEGVDVEAGKDPLTVKRWKPKRAKALLARFGR